jgi:glutathione S-transferase
MAKLTVYGAVLSQPTRAVLWVLRMKGLECTFVKVNPMAGETETDDYLAKFPMGLIPAIEDTDAAGNLVRVSESHAILIYLCEKHGWTDLYPAAPADKARVNQWLHWHHHNFRRLTTVVMRPQFAALARGKAPAPAPEQARKAHALLRALELVMQHQSLKRQRFLAGDRATLADVSAYCEFDQLEYLGAVPGLGARYPVVGAWLARMKALPFHDAVRSPLVRLGKSPMMKRAKL